MFSTSWQAIKKQFSPRIHLHLLIISILIQAFGAICTKFAAECDPAETYGIIPIYLIMYLFILAGMGLQVVVWQYALKYYSLSFAYPFRSMVSFIVLLAAFWLFHESVTIMNIIGLTVITAGVVFLAQDKEILA